MFKPSSITVQLTYIIAVINEFINRVNNTYILIVFSSSTGSFVLLLQITAHIINAESSPTVV